MGGKQKIAIIALGTVSLLLAASISLTIAWYDGASHLALNNLNIALKDKELQISTDNANFETYLSSDELNKAGKFKAISSEFSDLWIQEKQDKPVFRDGFINSSKNVLTEPDDSCVATSGYFTQELFIKCNTSVYVTLDKEQVTFLPDEVDNRKVVQKIKDEFQYLSEEQILNNLNDVVKSLRLSILVLNDENDETETYPDYAYYIVDPYKDKSTAYSGILDTDRDGFFDFSQENKEILYGEAFSSIDGKSVEDCLVYNEPAIANQTVSEDKLTCFNSGTKEGVKKINFDASMANGLVLKEEPSVSLDDAENEVLIPLHAETSKRIVLSFYQEGWDKENTDFVKYSHFFVNVLFKIAKTKF